MRKAGFILNEPSGVVGSQVRLHQPRQGGSSALPVLLRPASHLAGADVSETDSMVSNSEFCKQLFELKN